MLTDLSIRNIVLIGRLDLSFNGGLSVLTGETGAGKSILLDALGLALGARAEGRLLRHGTSQASVTARFQITPDHRLQDLLSDHGIEAEGGELLLRRTLGADGRSKAFINDQPVGVALLRTFGERLVEIHGQFDNQRLLNPSAHCGLLDAYGRHDALVTAVAAAHGIWREAAAAREKAAADMAAAREEEDYLRHCVEELNVLDPQPGEEETLSAQRAMMMHGEQLIEAMNDASARLSKGDGVEALLQGAVTQLARVADKAEGRLDEALAALGRALDEAADGEAQLARAKADMDLDPAALEQSEERLFALRAMARKHQVAVDDLPELARDMSGKLAALEDGGAHLAALERAEADGRQGYVGAAEALSEARQKAAGDLDAAVADELVPLKMEKAQFITAIGALAEEAWGEGGMDRVAFQVATNPGAPPGPLNKIASGGEMARFMLALKVVLAEAEPVPTLIFDEVDAGVGGAVAAAVGERLAALAETCQVLVVTHSPQVAARGIHHWRVAKSEDGESDMPVATSVSVLDDADRKEEIARMLAGATVTDEARAAADSLLAGNA